MIHETVAEFHQIALVRRVKPLRGFVFFYAVSKILFRNRKSKQGIIDADIMGAISIGSKSKFTMKEVFLMNVKNEIKSIIVRSGMTMQQVVDLLSDEYGWSDSISNFSNKLSRGSLRYREAIQLADVMGYDLVWQKRRDG